MGEHKVKIKIISLPENNILSPQSYTLQKLRLIFAYFTHDTSKLTIKHR